MKYNQTIDFKITKKKENQREGELKIQVNYISFQDKRSLDIKFHSKLEFSSVMFKSIYHLINSDSILNLKISCFIGLL